MLRVMRPLSGDKGDSLFHINLSLKTWRNVSVKVHKNSAEWSFTLNFFLMKLAPGSSPAPRSMSIGTQFSGLTLSSFLISRLR